MNVPYLIVGLCDWYSPLDEPQSSTGLTQIVSATDWNEDCPVIRIKDCLSVNCVFWPADPLGLVEAVAEVRSRMGLVVVEEVADVSEVLVVITHHEDVAN